MLDGVDVKLLDADLLWGRIGLVPQKAYLFSGTVASNLRYGKPGPGQPGIIQMLLDVLAMRRAVALEVVRATAHRIPRGGTTAARDHTGRTPLAASDSALMFEP